MPTPRILHALDEELKALSSKAREAFLSKELHTASMLTASAREHAAKLGKEVHQLPDGSLALVTAGAHPDEIGAQVSVDPSYAVLGNQEAANAA